MSPKPVIMILDNPPEGEFEEEITDDTTHVPQIVASSSESEDEMATNNGYQLLPQEPEQEEHSVLSLNNELALEEAVASGPDFHSYINQMMNEEISRGPADEFQNHSNENHDLHPMEKDRIEKIKAVMTNITIPTSAIPEWARIVPEEEWKAQLVSSIKARHAFPTSRDSAQSNGDHFNNLTFVADFSNNST